MRYEVIPPLTVMQRLFVDRWWVNGGNIVEAIEHAGYDGLPTPSDKAKKGRRLLAAKPVQRYIDYLKEAEQRAREREAERNAAIAKERAARAVEEAARRGQSSADLVCGSEGTGEKGVSGASGTEGLGDVAVPGCGHEEGGNEADPISTGETGAIDSVASENVDGSIGCVDGSGSSSSSCVDRPGAPRLYVREDLGPEAAGALIPSSVMVPASPSQEYGRELSPKEIREILADIARGAVHNMRDSRSRMRAIELAMRNLGMLVDASLRVNVDADQQKQLTAAERKERLSELEGFFEKVKAQSAGK